MTSLLYKENFILFSTFLITGCSYLVQVGYKILYNLVHFLGLKMVNELGNKAITENLLKIDNISQFGNKWKGRVEEIK